MKTTTRMILFTILVSIFMLTPASLSVHRSFAAEGVSPLTALRDGLDVADDMIAQGKLDPEWADALSSVTVAIRNIKGFSEYVVTLTRSSGTPAEISIYINMSGGYSGSNVDSGAGPGEEESSGY